MARLANPTQQTLKPLPTIFRLLLLLSLSLSLLQCAPPTPSDEESDESSAADQLNASVSRDAEAQVRQSLFPLAQLLNQRRSALDSSLRKRPWIKTQPAFQLLSARTAPSWASLLTSLFPNTRQEWSSPPMPAESPFAETHQLVLCQLFPVPSQANNAASSPQAEPIAFISFLVSRESGLVLLHSLNSIQPLINPEARDLALAELALDWLEATDTRWQKLVSQRKAQHQNEDVSIKQFQFAQARLGSLLEAIRSYQAQHGSRPKNLQILFRSGLLASPDLLSWPKHTQAGEVQNLPILYFERPILIADDRASHAVILAAPIANDNGTRSVGTSSGRIVAAPEALAAKAIAKATK